MERQMAVIATLRETGLMGDATDAEVWQAAVRVGERHGAGTALRDPAAVARELGRVEPTMPDGSLDPVEEAARAAHGAYFDDDEPSPVEVACMVNAVNAAIPILQRAGLLPGGGSDAALVALVEACDRVPIKQRRRTPDEQVAVEAFTSAWVTAREVLRHGSLAVVLTDDEALAAYIGLGGKPVGLRRYRDEGSYEELVASVQAKLRSFLDSPEGTPGG